MRWCARTLAIYHPGEVIEGVRCVYHWTGEMPCTGRLVCHLCGEEKSDEEVDEAEEVST